METKCNYKAFDGMMPPCVLKPGHSGDHIDGCGGSYSNTEAEECDLPSATLESIGAIVTPKNDSPDTVAEVKKITAALTKYLKGFAYTPDGKCVRCGATLGGILGSFSWGLQNGEGACSCGYPARAYHQIEGFGTYSGILQYHQSRVELVKTELP